MFQTEHDFFYFCDQAKGIMQGREIALPTVSLTEDTTDQSYHGLWSMVICNIFWAINRFPSGIT